MAVYSEVNPETFIKRAAGLPRNGRGAWTREGINGDYRYHYRDDDVPVGGEAEASLAHWAVSAGVQAIKARLNDLGHLEDRYVRNYPATFGKAVRNAVIRFQTAQGLDPDGTVGRTDAVALFTPVIDAAERASGIPRHLLRGETMHESALDPGAVGYFIYYGADLDYRGVDRGMSQINSLANDQVSWAQAFDPSYSLPWSARRMRSYYDGFKRDFPGKADRTYWDAAVCAHNNPSAARAWARAGEPTTEAAATYVAAVLAATY